MFLDRNTFRSLSERIADYSESIRTSPISLHSKSKQELLQGCEYLKMALENFMQVIDLNASPDTDEEFSAIPTPPAKDAETRPVVQSPRISNADHARIVRSHQEGLEIARATSSGVAESDELIDLMSEWFNERILSTPRTDAFHYHTYRIKESYYDFTVAYGYAMASGTTESFCRDVRRWLSELRPGTTSYGYLLPYEVTRPPSGYPPEHATIQSVILWDMFMARWPDELKAKTSRDQLFPEPEHIYDWVSTVNIDILDQYQSLDTMTPEQLHDLGFHTKGGE
jgi:hypothetical protein